MNAAELLFWSAWALVAYSYVIFPILLAVFARLFGERKRMQREMTADEELPQVAMVVAAFNEASVLPAKLANTWAIDYPADRFELFIGSDGSDDGSEAILNGCHDPRLRAFLFQERRGKISVLNDVARQPQAEILVMSDANTMFQPDAIRKLVRHFADSRVGCVSGELGLERDGGVSGEGLYWKYEGWIKRAESRLGFLIGCNGGIFAMRRELFEELPASTVVEDFVLTLRVLERGHRVVFEPDARATEPACDSSRAEMIRKTRIGAGNFQALGLTWRLLLPQYGFRAFAFWGHKVLRWCVPLFLVVALAANAALLSTQLYQVLFVLQLLGALTAAWAYNARPNTAPPRWTRPISYFYLMNYALFCGFLRFLLRTQRVTWDRATR